MEKIYVAYKLNTSIMPHPICKFHIDSIPLDLYQYGLRYFEDDIGWYYKFIRIKCSKE